jgi:hypothetical protein
MYENDLALRDNDQVRTARQAFGVLAKSDAESSENPSHCQFRFCALPADSAHPLASFRWGQGVRHVESDSAAHTGAAQPSVYDYRSCFIGRS